MDKNFQKTSIRFFNDVSVRSVWDDVTNKWWCSAMDICEALTKSKNPRSYWTALKIEILSCQQFVGN